MKRSILIPLLTAATLVGSTAAMGVVTLVNGPSVFGINGDTSSFDAKGTTASGSFTFGAASDSVFAVTLFGLETDSNVLTPSITLDPTGLNISLTPLISVQSADNGDLQGFVFAADIGTVSAGALDFAVDWDTSASNYEARGSAITYQLSGATITGAVTDGSGVKDTPLSLPGLSAGSFAIDMLTDGSTSISTSPYGSPTGSGGHIAPGNRGTSYGYYSNASGTLTTGWDGNKAQLSVAAGFQVVPEPSTYALMLGFLALGGVLLRRRIRNR